MRHEWFVCRYTKVGKYLGNTGSAVARREAESCARVLNKMKPDFNHKAVHRNDLEAAQK